MSNLQKSREPSFWEVMDSFVSLAYGSLAASRMLLQRLLACLNFTLESENLSFWYKQKKWFLWTMAAAQAPANHGDQWGLTWYFVGGIYRSIPTWIHSKSSPATEPPSLKILSNGTLQINMKNIPIRTRIVINYAMKRASYCVFDGKLMETDTATWSEFPNGAKAIVEQILVSEERKKSKRAGLWEPQSGIRVGKLTIWVRSFEL